jgi:hypothetical protein
VCIVISISVVKVGLSSVNECYVVYVGYTINGMPWCIRDLEFTVLQVGYTFTVV